MIYWQIIVVFFRSLSNSDQGTSALPEICIILEKMFFLNGYLVLYLMHTFQRKAANRIQSIIVLLSTYIVCCAREHILYSTAHVYKNDHLFNGKKICCSIYFNYEIPRAWVRRIIFPQETSLGLLYEGL